MVMRPAPRRGVSYLALLLAVAITSGALAAGATVWSQVQRREREKQLLWAGDQIRKALVAYSSFGTGGADGMDNFPRSLDELLLDSRSPARRRFLRKVYDDPMTHSTDWGLVRNLQGRIVGVFSRSTAQPLKTGRFPQDYSDFARARTYAEWRFSALTELRSARPPGAAASTAAAASAAGTASAASVAAAGSAGASAPLRADGTAAAASAAAASAANSGAAPADAADPATTPPAEEPAPPPEGPPPPDEPPSESGN